MKKILPILFLIQLSLFCQQSFDFHSPENIKRFADYLFCDADYLRAAEQYYLISDTFNNDSINFKIILCYSNLNLYENVIEFYKQKQFFELKADAGMIYLKSEFLLDSLKYYKAFIADSFKITMNEKVSNYSHQLESVYNIQNRDKSVSKEKILEPFNSSQRKNIESFYDLSINPDYKSPALAGIMSAVIPGSGKMYVGEWGDGITGLLLTSLFAFLAYDNFQADHTTRAWIFTGVGTFFYAGNIYGSISSAQIFNARIDFEFQNGFKLFLNQENYFIPEYDFCN